jgi:hypothetical protein
VLPEPRRDARPGPAGRRGAAGRGGGPGRSHGAGPGQGSRGGHPGQRFGGAVPPWPLGRTQCARGRGAGRRTRVLEHDQYPDGPLPGRAGAWQPHDRSRRSRRHDHGPRRRRRRALRIRSGGPAGHARRRPGRSGERERQRRRGVDHRDQLRRRTPPPGFRSPGGPHRSRRPGRRPAHRSPGRPCRRQDPGRARPGHRPGRRDQDRQCGRLRQPGLRTLPDAHDRGAEPDPRPG